MIRYITAPYKWFLKLEAASGLVLLVGVAIALLLSNSGYSNYYFGALNTHFQLGIEGFGLNFTIQHWINDVLMVAFFFVVTLEIKREFINGELSSRKRAMLPIIGAFGGMLVPALFYIIININSIDSLRGWAIPSATDIAFSIGVLSLLGSRISVFLKVFLLALAIIDDLGAIIIIAFFYSNELQYFYLLMMVLSFFSLIILNKLGFTNFLPYCIIGLFLWFFTHESGIHSTISGVILALAIPHNKDNENRSPLLKLERSLSPYVAFGIMPLFAFANAGVSLDGLSINLLFQPVPLGILCGLFFGKQLGVFLFSYLAIKFRIAEMPPRCRWVQFYGVTILTGIGFTMSLFIGNIAFDQSPHHIEGLKIGVIVGSLLSAIVGYLFLFLSTSRKKTM